MAAASSTRALHEELFCPICLDYFTEPVILTCQHNFCRTCISTSCAGLGGSFACPQCKVRSRPGELRPNTQLGKVAERAREMASILDPCGSDRWDCQQEMCQKHQEVLKLFCMEDTALICVVCVRSKEHRAHMVVPVEEAAEEFKVNTRAPCPNIFCICISLQSRVETERNRATQMFQQLQRNLQDRENHILQGFSQVTKDLRKMEENNRKVHQGAPLLQERILELEEKCQQPDTEFLKVKRKSLGKEVEKRGVCVWLQGPWKRFHLFLPSASVPEILTLDPNSAHPRLAISADRRTASRQDVCPAPSKISQRFYPSFCVLGSEGFTGGRHHWLVQLKGRCGWALGVAHESVNRKRPVVLQPAHGVWAVELGPFQLHSFAAPSEAEAEVPPPKLRKTLVSLDYEAGRLAFSDPQSPEPLFTFRTSFKGKLYPFFWLWSPEASITLCP
uniref:Zinc finger protein RFP-like n=1 Tax=Varanus komodoensis TaxID=61221 RepID=A0A8D2KTJ0_VARKO